MRVGLLVISGVGRLGWTYSGVGVRDFKESEVGGEGFKELGYYRRRGIERLMGGTYDLEIRFENLSAVMIRN